MNALTILKNLRTLRGFNVDTYIKEKTTIINDFFRKNKLDSAVVGVSGGIDSALVIALLYNASIQPDSPIKKILG